MTDSVSNSTLAKASQDDTQAGSSSPSKDQSQRRGGFITKFPGGYGVNVPVHLFFNNLNAKCTHYSEEEFKRKDYKGFDNNNNRLYSQLLSASCNEKAEKWRETGDYSDAEQIEKETGLTRESIERHAESAGGLPSAASMQKLYDKHVDATIDQFPLHFKSKYSPSRLGAAFSQTISRKLSGSNESHAHSGDF